ncbi:WXG100-like domain-containing protein [Amycolatopsis jiangsuensis]|uniref:Outer membrane channel protein CpnT-like N-terminal domain-containing protein n=1 Tax=Amycolatopsis jiangsuensis TaxID=1181879 RepID=A0A840J6Q8_9PSEU|nr:hypothetical protein [Amycolatopsis jiangsuensis]MBB4689078.1 hypothetical protein [Amycolatopsis jiangsuensis]
MIPEPANELYAAVKAMANPWPPDNEEFAQQLGAAWQTVGDSATKASTQVSALQQGLASMWRDEAGAGFGARLSGGVMSLQQIGQSSAQLAASAIRYAQVLVEIKTAITKTIAANLPTFLQLGSPLAGQAGAAQQRAMVAEIAAALRAMVEAKAAELGGATPPPPPGKDKDDGVLGSVAKWAGAASAVAGFAALFPPLTPFAAPVAALTGGVALVAHGIIASQDPTNGGKWVDVGSDALGLVPGVKAVGGVVKAVPELATTVDAIKSTVDIGLQAPGLIAEYSDSPEVAAHEKETQMGSLASNVFGAIKAVR